MEENQDTEEKPLLLKLLLLIKFLLLKIPSSSSPLGSSP